MQSLLTHCARVWLCFFRSGKELTFLKTWFVSGVGDTFGTCFGPLSRNRKFGYRLGQGETMEQILASSTEVAEGVETSKALVNLIRTKCKGYRLDLKYPILFGVASILEGTTTPMEGLKGLMSMPMQMENFDERPYEFVVKEEE
jgi:glycerol-3-phosphate dehydrogenase (NAD+)